MEPLRWIVKTGFLLLLLAIGLPARATDVTPAIAQDDSSAVILAYYRVGEDEYPQSSISLDQFKSHIEELTGGDYNVIALPDLVAALAAGRTLPPRTVALTFDGGYRSVLNNAVPLLMRHNLPFTLFVATNYLDRNAAQYIDWNALKKLARQRNVTIGLHPAEYTRLNEGPVEEIRRQINNARTRLREETGIEASLFAYPFGEYSAAYRDVVRASGFTAALGQQSGVAFSGMDSFALPRFTMIDGYGDIKRFAMTANALPLPVGGITPDDPHTTTRRPAIGFTIDDVLKKDIAKLSCFTSGDETTTLEIVGDGRIELRLDKDFGEDRVRINCTMPGPQGAADEDPRWRWFGMLLTMPPSPESQETVQQEE